MHKQQLEDWYYFSSCIYKINVPKYLELMSSVSEDYIDNDVVIDEIYPLLHSHSFQDDERIIEFVSEVSQSAWNILDYQGYEMSDLDCYVGELWMQTHNKFSSMDIHSHGYGSQLTAFYILECDENSPKLCIHDPRPAKLQCELFEKQDSEIKYSSRTIEFDMSPGLLFFTNSWLPHSFSRNRSEKPFKFIHINFYVRQTLCDAELPIVV